MEMLISIILFIRVSWAYSSRYTAAPSPRGTLINPVNPSSHKEPIRAG